MKNKKLIYDGEGKVRFAPNFDFASLYPYQQSIINLNIKNLIRKMKIKKIYGEK